MKYKVFRNSEPDFCLNTKTQRHKGKIITSVSLCLKTSKPFTIYSPPYREGQGEGL